MSGKEVTAAREGLGVGPAKPKGGRPRTNKERAHIDARRVQVELLELAGASIAEIAETLQVSRSTAYEDVKAVRAARRAELGGERIMEERDLELTRLERLRRVNVRAAEAGDTRAGQLLLSISDRKAKLLGLDAPKETRVTGAGGGPVQLAGLGVGVSNEDLADLLKNLPDPD
jgi:hypothetical protein